VTSLAEFADVRMPLSRPIMEDRVSDQKAPRFADGSELHKIVATGFLATDSWAIRNDGSKLGNS